MTKSSLSTFLVTSLLSVLLVGCWQGGGTPMSPPPLPGSLAEDTQKLRADYEKSCRELGIHCDRKDDSFCDNFYDLMSTSFCQANLGDRTGVNSPCSCADVCKPDKLQDLPVAGLESSLKAVKKFNGGKEFNTQEAYGFVKSLSGRVSFAPQNGQSSNFADKKIEAMKVIQSLESGSYLGELSSFTNMADLMGFIDQEPLLKSRFLNNYNSSSTQKPKITEGSISLRDGKFQGNQGDLLKYRGQFYAVDKDRNGDFCLKSMDFDDECSSPVKDKIPLDKSRKINVNYSSEGLTEIHTSCVLDTECSNPPESLGIGDAKVTFTPSSSLSGGYKKHFDEVTACVRKIGGSREFQRALKANRAIGSKKGEEVFQNIKQREMNVVVSQQMMKCIGAKTVAKATPGVPRIKLNSCLKNKSKESTVNTLIHEYLHVMGYVTNPHNYKVAHSDFIYQTGAVAEALSKSMCGF